MKEIYLIQSYSGTILARAIKIFTRYKYVHMSLSLDNNLNKMYSFGRKKYYNPLNGGFIIENKNGKFFKVYKNTECRVYKINIGNKQYNDLIDLLKKFEENPKKYRYDIIGLVLKMFNINIKRKNHYVCTQFVGELLDQSSIHNFDKPLNNLKAKDFENIPFKELIYVGKIKEYQ